MKKVIFSFAVLICASGVYAQTDASDNKWADSKASTANTENNIEGDFSKTSIKMQNRKITFSNLPQISKSAVVIITNSDGEAVLQGKVNPVESAVDIRYLEKGTYYIHLKYKNEEKKGFVLNL